MNVQLIRDIESERTFPVARRLSIHKDNIITIKVVFIVVYTCIVWARISSITTSAAYRGLANPYSLDVLRNVIETYSTYIYAASSKAKRLTRRHNFLVRM
jgi:hypothetical protein